MNAGQQMLCGDESNAVVVDLGSHQSRFGTSGQDSPRHLIRSDIGRLSDSRVVVGESGLRIPRDNIHINSLHRQSSTFWEDVEAMMKYGIEDSMSLSVKDYNIMLSKGKHFTSLEDQAKLSELMFESLCCPAMFLHNSASLSAFSAGRSNALVVDLSHSATSINPVIDGYQLNRCSVLTNTGAHSVDEYINQLFQQTTDNNSNMDVVDSTPSSSSINIQYNMTKERLQPWFLCNKQLKQHQNRQTLNYQESFLNMHRMEIIRDLKHWMCFIPVSNNLSTLSLPVSNVVVDITASIPNDTSNSSNGDAIISTADSAVAGVNSLLPPPYELPDGTMIPANTALCLAANAVYFPDKNNSISGNSSDSVFIKVEGTAVQHTSKKRARQLLDNFDALHTTGSIDLSKESLSDLIYLSLAKADTDIRKDLLSNLLFVGGSSLLTGLLPRTMRELQDTVPTHFKCKMIPTLPVEKQHAAWIGGSILSICGSFNQLWASKQEYEEHGTQRLAAMKFKY